MLYCPICIIFLLFSQFTRLSLTNCLPHESFVSPTLVALKPLSLTVFHSRCHCNSHSHDAKSTIHSWWNHCRVPHDVVTAGLTLAHGVGAIVTLALTICFSLQAFFESEIMVLVILVGFNNVFNSVFDIVLVVLVVHGSS